MGGAFSPLGFCNAFLLPSDGAHDMKRWTRTLDMGNGAYVCLRSRFTWIKNCQLLYPVHLRPHIDQALRCPEVVPVEGGCPRLSGNQAVCKCMTGTSFLCEPLLPDEKGYLKSCAFSDFRVDYPSCSQDNLIPYEALPTFLGQVYAQPELADGKRMAHEFACESVVPFEDLRPALAIPVRQEARYTPPAIDKFKSYTFQPLT